MRESMSELWGIIHTINFLTVNHHLKIKNLCVLGDPWHHGIELKIVTLLCIPFSFTLAPHTSLRPNTYNKENLRDAPLRSQAKLEIEPDKR